jgi:hypothetical protein
VNALHKCSHVPVELLRDLHKGVNPTLVSPAAKSIISRVPRSIRTHTLSDRYKMHLLDAASSEDEFEQLLENLPESPTLIVDFPGNKTSKILEFAARHASSWQILSGKNR